MKKHLLSSKAISSDLAALALRLVFGLSMLFAHGFGKLERLIDGQTEFYDFIGIGPLPSLILTVFAEFLCAGLVALGLFTRLSTIPLIITMAVAVFMVHAEDPFGKQEMGLLYLTGYLAILLTGPGKYSLDKLLLKR